jgi:hypothetical protein
MGTIRINTGSAIAGAVLGGGSLLLLGMQVTFRAQSCTLTQEQCAILRQMSLVDLPDGRGGTCRTIRISGVNVQIVNGMGATNGNPNAPDSVDAALTDTNCVGNLILGYNELRGGGDDRTGSHNLVLGTRNNYSEFGGIAGGYENGVDGIYASAVGGTFNHADGLQCVVVGGQDNRCGGEYAMIGGGQENVANGLGA